MSVRADEHRVRSVTLDLLRTFGLTTVFGNPGSTELPMFRDLPSDFRYIMSLQESVSVGMADGFAQATRNAALVNLHSAAGLGHALGNIFTAFRNKTPLVVTAGQQARSILPFDPYLFAQQPTEFPKPYVKWACEPARAEDVPAAIARAYHIAMQPPRGPVFVSIPVDDWDRPCAPLAPRRVSQRIEGDTAMLAEMGEALAAAARPVLVAGPGIARDEAWPETIRLAELHNMPVWISPMSPRNGFPQDHSLFAGFLPPLREQIVASLDGHDLILVLGGGLSLYHVEGNGPHAPPGCAIYLIADDPDIAVSAPAGTAVISDTRAGVAALLRVSPPSPPSPRTAPRRREPPPVPDGVRLTDAYLLHRLAVLRPADAIVVEEAPSARPALRTHLPMRGPDSFFAGASGGLGHGLPAAVGVALARPDAKVIALIGDGSAMYAIQALWNAAQLALPISVLILNNRRYEALMEFGKLFELEPVGCDLPGIDFVELAAALGVEGTRVTDPADVDAAVAASLESTAPSLVEFMIQ